jgi:dTDP-glucose pyrophosphorylase
MVNIVIPMAGAGSRFVNAGYETPKPFIDVLGKPMIVRVMENLFLPNAKYFLIIRRNHLAAEPELIKMIKEKFNVVFIQIDKLTEGAACTILYARKFINNKFPLLLANSDQIIDIDIRDYISDCNQRNLDGSIMTFVDKSRNIKWSFAKIDENGLVENVKEKVGISDYATVGLYYFNKGSDFVDSAIDMIIDNDRVNGEYYTCPVYNYLIQNGGKIGIYNINFSQMHGLGTPEDLNEFKALSQN